MVTPKKKSQNLSHIVHTLKLPYTRVNKRIRLFLKLQGNMHLIPKYALNNERQELPHPQNHDASLVPRVHDSVLGR